MHSQLLGLSSQERERLRTYEELAERFSLIPLKPNSKIPCIKNWQQYCQSKREFKIQDFIRKDGSEVELHNAGICTGPVNQLIVLDVDDHVKFEEYKAINGFDLLDTFTVKTGKGYHYYYQYDVLNRVIQGNRSLRNSGFDIRGDNGFVVAPGSIHENVNLYQISNNIEIRKSPVWLWNFATNNKPQTIDIEKLQISDNNKDLIVNGAEVGKRSEASMKVILSLLEAGYDEITIRGVFEQFSIGEKLSQKGDYADRCFESEISRAKEYLQRKHNDELVKSHVSKPKYSVISMQDIMTRDTKMEFLIDKIWPMNDTLLLVGPSGVGKSIFTLNLCANIIDKSQKKLFGEYDMLKGDYRVLIVQS